MVEACVLSGSQGGLILNGGRGFPSSSQARSTSIIISSRLTRGTDPKLDNNKLNAMPITQEVYFVRIWVSPNSVGYSRRFTKPFLHEYVVVPCIVKPNPRSVKKLFCPEQCSIDGGSRRPHSPKFFALFQ